MLRSNLVKAVRPITTTRSITQVSSTLLANSRQKVIQSNDAASDQLGDLMVKRWLGGVRGPNASGQGTDSDRVRGFTPPSKIHSLIVLTRIVIRAKLSCDRRQTDLLHIGLSNRKLSSGCSILWRQDERFLDIWKYSPLRPISPFSKLVALS